MIKRHTGVAEAILVASIVSPVAAWAQAACGSRDEMISTLAETFKEEPVGIGLLSPSHAMELLISESGSWTLLVTTPSGRSCIVSAGESWISDMPLDKGGKI